ncbi:circular bacteriocin, circularin A/uberolysin family [Thermoactinomyces sp. DSM 45892]|uniref:circular bacteriocin, circularin A/uberolysin family n=1 Tax=Thermoactinomyces sp. DSM 45892 TaxID=1882753 RepID=UPI00089A1F16|nr:circular bacteriocin, circularin A/uberolysin family [Thermoactinomyces sp. DSM 45892]SDY72339.1 circular bacteriocin, circularin A/uberolysin family [Thermoactinomyces sp. DSM 45892]
MNKRMLGALLGFGALAFVFSFSGGGILSLADTFGISLSKASTILSYIEVAATWPTITAIIAGIVGAGWGAAAVAACVAMAKKQLAKYGRHAALTY